MTGPVVASDIDAIRDAVRTARADAAARGVADARVALVPTMGALHAGHLALVQRAREVADVVVVSIFVNPLQFGQAEDLAAYPRTLESDVALLAEAGADLVFAPTEQVMYPNGPTVVRITGGPVASQLEGASRRGHFEGVLTVVAKLLHIVGPDAVLFGRKDAQQVFLVQQMVRDLDFPVTVEVVDTVRDTDGLALSSRNRRLGPEARIAARALHGALEAAASAADRGVDATIAAAQASLMGEPLVALDYFAIVDPGTFQPVDDGYRGPARVLVAATVGGTRLIDNDTVVLG
ncbi:pantoate--beta-alanine ligase [Naasia sp. SYSU D00057]|uniref:pantoate--beta-alanine ligase n=1 Tax=Naasia sp. SYSU D00057 TaxID=2817380 RepID=UPI001B30709E|nr:pantoate--beta-alanine ligase [Naasia sp. SYSU D00057]